MCRRNKLDYQKQNRVELVASRSNMNLFWETVKKLDLKKKQIFSVPSSHNSGLVTLIIYYVSQIWTIKWKVLMNIEKMVHLMIVQ